VARSLEGNDEILRSVLGTNDVNRKYEEVNQFLRVALPEFNKLAEDLAAELALSKDDLFKSFLELAAKYNSDIIDSLAAEFQALDASSDDFEDQVNELLKKASGIPADSVESVCLLAKRVAIFAKFQNEVAGFNAYSDWFCSEDAHISGYVSDESFTVKTRKKVPVALKPRKHSDLPLPTRRSVSLEGKPVNKAVAPVPEMSMSLRNLKMLNFKSDSETLK
jgi:hypothetical protein